MSDKAILWLSQAAEMPAASLDKAAHALGWPDSRNIHRPRRVLWRNPYRNGFGSYISDPDWEWMVSRGLARRRAMPGVPEAVAYSLTPDGIAVVRLRLQAEKEVTR